MAEQRSKISAVISADVSEMVSGMKRAEKALQGFSGFLPGVQASLNRLNAGVNTLVFIKLGEVALQAGRALAGMAASSAQSIDNLSKLAQRTGFAYAEMASLEMAGNLAGVGVERLAVSLTMADRMFDNARTGSKSAQDAFARLGLSLDELGQQTSQQRFESIARAIANLPDPAARAAVAMQIFGRSGAELLPLFGSISENLAASTADAQKFGLALSNVQGRNVEAMNDAWTRAGYAVNGVVTQVTAQLAPAIQGVVDAFTSLFDVTSGEALGTAVVNAFWDAIEILARGMDLVIGAFQPMINGFQAVFNVVASTFGEFSATVDWWAVSTEVFQRAISLFQGIGNAFLSGFKIILSGLNRVAAFLLEQAATLMRYTGASDAEATLSNMADSARRAATRLWEEANENANEAAEQVANAFREDFRATQLGQQMVEGFDGGLERQIEAWRAAADERNAATEEALKRGGNAAAASLSSAMQTTAGFDVRTTQGLSQALKAMTQRKPEDQIQQQQLDAQERTADATESLVEEISNLGLEAVGF